VTRTLARQDRPAAAKPCGAWRAQRRPFSV